MRASQSIALHRISEQMPNLDNFVNKCFNVPCRNICIYIEPAVNSLERIYK